VVEVGYGVGVWFSRSTKANTSNEADPGAIEQGNVLADDARFLQSPDAAPARRGAQGRALGQVLIRELSVRLQVAEQLAIGNVEHGLSLCKNLANNC
jgi:hypothetical protein